MPLLFHAYGFSGSSSRAARFPVRICAAARAARLPREITLDRRRGPGAILGPRTRRNTLFKRIDRNTKDGDVVGGTGNRPRRGVVRLRGRQDGARPPGGAPSG